MSSARWWAEQQRAQTIKRELAGKAQDLAQACQNGHELPELLETLAGIYREALAADPASRQRVRDTAGVMAEMSEAARRPEGARILTGIPTIDYVTRGIAEGEVFTVIARPQVGKSALATQMTLNAAQRSERCVFFSLEMPREQTVARLVQQATGVDTDTVDGWAKGEWKDLAPRQVAAISAIQERIVVIDRGRSGIEHLDGSMTEAEAVLKGRPRLAVIDYLGLLSVGQNSKVPLYQRVSEAAIEVKSFAKRHHCAVILLSQAGRDVDSKRSEGAAPLGLDSARDSGVVEEAGDCLLTMWRPELARPESEEDGIIEAHLVKNRRRSKRPRFSMRLDLVSTAIGELVREER